MMRRAHEGTTAQLGAAYPFVSAPRARADQVAVGLDATGALYSFDPFALYRAGAITSPNMVVLGQVGRGKSSFVKSYCFRQFAHGRRIIVLDPKGEYGPFAEATEGRVLRLSASSSVRLNPLACPANEATHDDGPVPPEPARPHQVGPSLIGSHRARSHRALEAICEATLGRRLAAGEALALRSALGAEIASGVPRLRQVAERLLAPAGVPPVFGIGVEELTAFGRECALCLFRLLGGEFGGVFDGSEPFDCSGAVTVIDLSEYVASSALSVLAVAVLSTVLAAARDDGRPTIIVIDEAWAMLANPYAAAFFESAFKLARAYGLSNLLVAHRPSDLSRTGCLGLVADAETAVLFGLSAPEAAAAGQLFSLGRREQEVLRTLRRATALWSVAGRQSVVRHLLSEMEVAFVDTDQKMRAPESR